ncbi:MAG: hypothetical protein WBF90_17100 [Rivularia sp. (in: cyanobacteria)]|jgi:hypothetical protein
MASIKISELRPVGSELFVDSESFLNELNDQEISATVGAGTVATVVSQASISVGISIVSASVVTQTFTL